MWDNSVFDAAFDAAGMREPVVPIVGGVVRPAIMAKFERPQQIMADDGVHDTAYSIEYAHHECADLKAGHEIRIGADRYRVSQQPARQGDGYYAIAMMEPK